MQFSLPVATAIWGFASAVAIVAIGAVTLRGGTARPRGAVPFGLFCIVWGLQIVLGNAANVATSEALAEPLYLLFLALLIVLPYLLVEFSASQLETSKRSVPLVGMRLLVGLLSASTAALLVLDPSAIYRGLTPIGARFFPEWGPLFVPLVQFPLVASFALATLALFTSYRRAPTPRTASRAAILLAGLGVYVSFSAANNFTFYAVSLVLFDFSSSNLLFTILYALLMGVAFSIGLLSLLSANGVLERERRARQRLLAVTFLVPLPLGVGEAMLATGPYPFLETVGLWRLAGVAIIAYGIARWRIYDLPQRATRVASVASGVAASTAGGAAAFGVSALLTSTVAIPALLGFLVAGGTLLPSIRLTARLFKPHAPTQILDDPSYGQRIDAYRAALEASIARGTLEEDAEFLAALRARFRITDAEERVLLYYAKSSVVVAREKHAWDAYERLRLLGEGGGGRTWLARDRARDRLVVLKEPLERWQNDPATREAVLREARLAARVRHPNVVAIEEVVEGKGSPVIVMEYLEGGTIAGLLRAKGTLAPAEAVELVAHVLRGLDAIHNAGIVHRDIKPSNILLDGDGVPKIADFGVALPVSSNKTQIDVGSTARAGTLLYMAPEVRQGYSVGDRKADLYACAAILHECLYGAPPGAQMPVVLRRDVPAPVSAALARGLSERPEDRPANARAFADELTRAAGARAP